MLLYILVFNYALASAHLTFDFIHESLFTGVEGYYSIEKI